MNNGTKAAIVFPPGEFIKEELEARGWIPADLAEIMGCDASVISRIINGQAIKPEIARKLGEAFGTSAQLWLNLESQYALSRLEESDNAVARRARLYSLFPAKDMLKRGWIQASEDIDVLEKRFLDFFGIRSLDEKPSLAHAARKSNPDDETTPSQMAWLLRAKQLAFAVSASKYSEKSFKEALERLRLMLPNPEEIRRVPRILADAGVRLVVVEALPNTRIDGVCFWLDRYSPVIALSLRFDRIDGFWHTLLHECDHVQKKHGMDTPIVDTDLVGDEAITKTDRPEEERQADKFACEFSIKKTDLDKFIARIRPFYSKARITVFAARMNVHPGIVVGQLQHRGELPYSHFRDMLVKVKDIIAPTAIIDGWGDAILL